MDPISEAAAAAGPWVALLGLLLAGLYGLLRGTLMSSAQVDRLTEQWEARLHEVAEQAEQRIAESHDREQLWRTAYERSEERGRIADAQVGELITVVRTTETLLRGIAWPGAAPTRPAGIPLPGRPDGRGGDSVPAD